MPLKKFRTYKKPKKSMSKKSRSKKVGKSKKLRKTRRLKRRSSKKRGGVSARKPNTDALLRGLLDAERARANPLLVNSAFDGFIGNENMIKRIYREGGFDQVTSSILDRFRRLLSNPRTMQLIRDRTEELNIEGDEDDEIKNWRDIYNNLQETNQELAELYNNFIQELFSLAFPGAASP